MQITMFKMILTLLAVISIILLINQMEPDYDGKREERARISDWHSLSRNERQNEQILDRLDKIIELLKQQKENHA